MARAAEDASTMRGKKVLILTGQRNAGPYGGSVFASQFDVGCKALERELPGIQCVTSAITDLRIMVQDGVVTIMDMRHDVPLESYDFVQFRNVSLARDYFMAAAAYLSHHSVSYTDEMDVQGTLFGKISQMVVFALHDLPVPDTFAVWPTERSKHEVQNFVQPPFIMKSNAGTMGVNNYLVKNWEMFDNILQKQSALGFVVQPFLPNDGDIRVLCIGDTSPTVFKRKGAAGSHLNNTSQQGSVTHFDKEKQDPAIMELATKTMRCYGRTTGGVDILIDKSDQKPYILEVNDTPALFSGVFQEKKVTQFAAFVQAKLTKE